MHTAAGGLATKEIVQQIKKEEGANRLLPSLEN